jgi:hypothetical protein
MKPLLQDLPRGTIITAAERAGEAKFLALAKDLGDPEMATRDVGWLCRKHKITGAQFIEIWRDHHVAQAIERISQKLPELYDDILKDSRSFTTYCLICKGTGKPKKGSSDVACIRCEGTGHVTKPGSTNARKLMLEIAGLIGKKTGPQVVIKQDFTKPLGSVEDTSALVGRILETDSEEVDDQR